MGIHVELLQHMDGADLADICQATDDAISDGIGFNWVTPPVRETLEGYWKGVMVVPERLLLVGRLDGTVCGAIQLVCPTKSKETSAFAADIEAHFVAPWARGHGLAVELLVQAEREAAKHGFSVIRLSVRETQERALQIYSEHGYTEWGKLPYYEYVNGNMVAGHCFYKRIKNLSNLV